MAKRRKSLVRQCLAFGHLFEAEVLLELILRYWGHPFANDSTYRSNLHACAIDVLRESAKGKTFIEDVPPAQMNFIAAMWYVEWNSTTENSEDPTKERNQWLDKVRRALPSCFCDPKDLT